MSELLHPNVDEFIESYDPHTPVVIGKMKLTLAQALAAEKEACTANLEERTNQINRLRFLASIINAGEALHPEDRHLLEINLE